MCKDYSVCFPICPKHIFAFIIFGRIIINVLYQPRKASSSSFLDSLLIGFSWYPICAEVSFLGLLVFISFFPIHLWLNPSCSFSLIESQVFQRKAHLQFETIQEQRLQLRSRRRIQCISPSANNLPILELIIVT